MNYTQNRKSIRLTLLFSALIFFITSLSLAYFASIKRTDEKGLIDKEIITEPQQNKPESDELKDLP